jgi:hypothetical protein
VNSKPWTKETCNEELLDFLHCVDECVRRRRRKRELSFIFFIVLVVTTCLQIFEIIIKLETFIEILGLVTFLPFPIVRFYFFFV